MYRSRALTILKNQKTLIMNGPDLRGAYRDSEEKQIKANEI
jgi:hypothetical protein